MTKDREELVAALRKFFRERWRDGEIVQFHHQAPDVESSLAEQLADRLTDLGFVGDEK